ncbi:hypothetical protein H4R21_002618 [Coemansia helicoidea]|uniref:Uncharacterized protein n=1 Tax=Coemansia helicoidea TaxID=1286919 RepID=A0ACC1L5P4_9FUNG|nr:hypothetical protein H4R21_002618 [Coemansia helicoidea]
MISNSAAPAERRSRTLLSMRPSWLRKDTAAAAAVADPHSPVSAKIKELAATAGHAKPKALSRTRVRELLTLAVIRLMERMIAELFPCAGDGDPDGAFRAGGGGSRPLPSFEEFLKHICRRTRTPLTCMCLALLYLTRLRANHPRSRGSPGSAYRLALSSLCVATKYLYDDAYHTCSWVQVSMGLFSQREVNQMEMEFMYFLHYQLGVTPTEWNQWIATLEAKLVARWQENGKADVIYGFGLFLSHECCEPGAQDAVRDIAWGEGGRSLLALLDNAIHVSGCVDPPKGSPSADSAVSDATCLPTPDPSAWCHVRSPATPGPSATAATTAVSVAAASIPAATPTTAHYAAVPALGDDAVTAAAHSHRDLCARRSYADYRCPSAFSARPISVCSVPTAPLAGGIGHLGGYVAGHPVHRHVSESRSYDWGQQTAHSAGSQRVPHVAGSGSTLAGYAHGPRPAKAPAVAASPFDQLSGGTTSIALSYSSDSRDSATAHGGFADAAAQVPVARGMHFGTMPRAAAASGYSAAALDRSAEPPCLPRISSMGGRGPGPIPISELRPAGAAAAGPAPGRGFRPNAYATIELSTAGGIALAGMQRGPSGDGAGLPSATASIATAAASLGRQASTARRFGSTVSSNVSCSGGGAASGSIGIHARNTASKSPSPSLKGNSRRCSWRYSGRHSAANIAQKLRAFAAFGRSSTHSSASSSGTGGNNYSSASSESYEDIHGRYAEAGLSLGAAAAAGIDARTHRTSAYPSHHTVSIAIPGHPHRLSRAMPSN